MFSFASTKAKRPGSNFALAVALMCGTALGVGALEAPAHAQKNKDKKKKGDQEEAAKPNYSKAFLAAYTPINEMMQGEAANPQGAKAMIPGLVAAVETDDDRNVAGGLIFNLGRDLNDNALKVQGLDLMVQSGKNDNIKLGQLHFTGYQIQRGLGNYAAARDALSQAIAVDYSFEGQMSDGSTRQFTTRDLHIMVSELYFDEQDYAGGLQYLRGFIDGLTNAGEMPEENWLRRGFIQAYENDQLDDAAALSAMLVRYYPTQINWANAVAVQRNSYNLSNHATLDIMRLADRTDSLRTGRDYVDYIEAADARRLPGEVDRVVKQGVAAGLLESSDVFVQEAQTTASRRIAQDRADFPKLLSDAREANSTAVTASAAGDVFLSYGRAAEAEEMYAIAVTRPGVDMGRIQTRLGIAQLDQGKVDEAKASFAKVQGEHAKVAELWMIFADNKPVV